MGMPGATTAMTAARRWRFSCQVVISGVAPATTPGTGALVIIPFALLTVRPEATERAIQRFKGWLTGHARQLLTAATLLAGGYMVISGTLRLLS
jgi:hypothetical protein